MLCFHRERPGIDAHSRAFLQRHCFKHDLVELTNVADNVNSGYQTRYNICKDSKLMDLIGPLHFDLGNQSKFLINSVNLRIKLERNKDSFTMMSATHDFKMVIQHASLFVRKVKVAPSIMIGHETALGNGAIKMPIRRTEVKSFALSSGMQSITIPNAFIGQLPTRLIMGMVSNNAFNGDFPKNPFNFKHYDLTYLCVLDGNRMIPSKPFQPKFDGSNCYSRCYMSLFTDLGRLACSDLLLRSKFGGVYASDELPQTLVAIHILL
ncbi:uncharacterized protein F54H12.2 [Trichonephila clavata]|uniref:Uncharacterized protein F54H12.2 n=1 Tax=Trichonephila clavata TaxID=2740835 RepID=A0A8X6FUT3_TRICU|nr:uncharacterized protein F54H12.2 [Trichonephila clavata]